MSAKIKKGQMILGTTGYLNRLEEHVLELASDCDAYEARIAELEATLTRAGLIDMATENRALRAELARVKAESLRVPDGEAMGVDHAPLGIGFTVDGHSGVFRRIGSGCSANPIETYALIKRAESDEEIRVPHGTIVQPVRLVRLEDAHE